MTRAKITLAIYAKQGTGQKDPRPHQVLARVYGQLGLTEAFWSTRPGSAVQDALFAEEEQRHRLERSNVATWLMMRPSENFFTGLSASSIGTYETCPLRFKLEREWNLPREVPAALHYGAAMHRVLHTFTMRSDIRGKSSTKICWNCFGPISRLRVLPTAISTI